MVEIPVSVVLCGWNSARYLPDCLQSLREQSVPPAEILLVDGGSTDGSREIVESYPEVRWLEQGDTPGLGYARNVGIAAARSEVVAFLDVDARAHPHWVRRLKEAFARQPDLAGVGGQGIEVPVSPADHFRAAYFQQWWGPRPVVQPAFLFGLCSAYRREALQDVHGFRAQYASSGEDVDLGLRLRQAGHRLAYDPEIIVYHARRDDWRSLRSMVWRWAYYGQWALLEQGKHRSGLYVRVRLLGLWARWLLVDAWRRVGRVPGWWRRPYYYWVETRACCQAQADYANPEATRLRQ